MATRATQSELSPTELSAAEIARAVRAGQLSAAEVVDAYIRRIEQVDPKLNAVVVPTFEQAREQAEQTDDARRQGTELGPLAGVPVTIKEQYVVAGTPTTVGLHREVDHIRTEEGPAVAALRKAGAIIVGKTNVVQLLAAHESDNPVYGRTSNPWDLRRTPGGSSGGEAAIIAARGSALGLGGDLGGSVRVPAHFTGISGFKPTSWRLPLSDTPADLFPPGQEAIVPQPGPMARTVADLSLAMDVLATADGALEGCPPVPWRSPDAVKVGELTVGIYEDDGVFPPSPAVRRAVREAADALEQAGTKVVRFDPPNAEALYRTFLGVLSADGAAGFRRMLRGEKPHPLLKGLIQGGSAPGPMRRIMARMVELGGQRRLARLMRSVGGRSADRYLQLVGQRTKLRAQFLAAMDDAGVDALLCPPYGLPAVPHGGTELLMDAASYAVAFNVIGAPAGVTPVTRVRSGEESDRPESRDPADRAALAAERESAGLPVGVQVMARPWRDDVVLAVMAAVEDGVRATPDFPSAPELAGGERPA
ncbi:MAG: amidase [Deltaproteobacteria bacterium]|jgi:fatty acid amide hydrolase|nr:amidase [Deltaproteobacteria bacterium]MBW2533997.1 amidase [Deltaproteobacteria bacterium]